MAKSLAHTFGQIIGNVLEAAIEPRLRAVARKHDLFLDKKGPRKARKGVKVTWRDHKGNKHDLDLVLERGGTESVIGEPIAFIETAWRRYTKHSRNKAQEIQGAINVLKDTYSNNCPFIGAILAGEFTEGALVQLRSMEFATLVFPYESIVKAFRSAGVDAGYEENTPESEFRKKLVAWNTLTAANRAKVAKYLCRKHKSDIATFCLKLVGTITRHIERIIVIPLHGAETEHATVADAVRFLSNYASPATPQGIYKYEVLIRYSNADRVTAEFRDKSGAIEFLKKYE